MLLPAGLLGPTGMHKADFGGITHGWTDQRLQLLSRMHRDQKTDECVDFVVV